MFGVKDKPRELKGMNNNYLENYDSKDLSSFLNSFFFTRNKF